MRAGIDIGGTTVKIGLIENREIVEQFEIKTIKESLFDDIFRALSEKLKGYKLTINDLDNIGFGIPGNVKDNYIFNMPNVGIKNINLDAIAKKYTLLDVKSSNDANCAALGEAISHPGYESSYFLTLGTGVGGGYVLHGKVIDGAHAACGEIGHMYIDPEHEYPCTCGLKGCLETVASATGIVRLARDNKEKYKTAIDFENISAKSVFDAAKAGDELGLFVLDYVAKSLGRALSILAVSNDVDAFYIGGGVSKVGKILIDAIQKYYDSYSFYACKNTVIKLAELGNSAGMLGAAYL